MSKSQSESKSVNIPDYPDFSSLLSFMTFDFDPDFDCDYGIALRADINS